MIRILVCCLMLSLVSCESFETKDERLDPSHMECYDKDGHHVKPLSPGSNLLILTYTKTNGWVIGDPKAHCFK